MINNRSILAGMSLAFFCGVGGGLVYTGVAQEPEEDTTAAAFTKWIEVRRLISQERADWRTGREALQERAALLQREIDAVLEKTAQVKKDVAGLEKTLADTKAENEKAKVTGTMLREVATRFEAQLRPLVKRMPDPVRERTKPLAQRLPDNSAETKIGPTERLQTVLGLLNELSKANGEIALSTEIHTLPDGQRVEVKAVYVGLAQAYFVSAKGDAGIGTPGNEGWDWTPDGSLAAGITDAIQIMQNKGKPRFIPLPVNIQ